MNQIPAHEVARKHSELKGYNLIGYKEVALEIPKLTIEAAIIQKQNIPPIHEFILKTVDIGFNTKQEIAGALGLEDELVKSNLIDCHREEYIDITSNSDNETKITLTESGQELCRTLKVQKIKDVTFERINFNGIKRQVIPNGKKRMTLLSHNEVKGNGIPIIASSPSGSPDIAEISCICLQTYDYRKSAIEDEYYDDGEIIVLKILKTKLIESMYLPAVLLQYEISGSNRSNHERLNQFAINGEKDSELGDIVEEKGLIHSIPKFKLNKPPDKDDLLDRIITDIGPELKVLKGTFLSKEENQDYLNKIKEEETKTTKTIKTVDATKEQLHEKLKSSRSHSKRLEDEITARGDTIFLPSWEHPRIFYETLRNAKERVILVTGFLSIFAFEHKSKPKELDKELKACLKRGINVTFVYGIGSETSTDRDQWKWKKAGEHLRKLNNEFTNFKPIDASTVERRKLHGTHEKMLIKDNDYIVVGSYNWLSRISTIERERNPNVSSYQIGGEASLQTSNKEAFDCCLRHIEKQYLS